MFWLIRLIVQIYSIWVLRTLASIVVLLTVIYYQEGRSKSHFIMQILLVQWYLSLYYKGESAYLNWLFLIVFVVEYQKYKLSEQYNLISFIWRCICQKVKSDAEKRARERGVNTDVRWVQYFITAFLRSLQENYLP